MGDTAETRDTPVTAVKPSRVEVLVNERQHRPCLACKAPLTFYKTAKNEKWMPFDGDPKILRQFYIDKPSGRVLAAIVEGVVHFATCPDRARFQGAKRAARG